MISTPVRWLKRRAPHGHSAALRPPKTQTDAYLEMYAADLSARDMHLHFLEIPLEIRLIIYNAFLQDHQIVHDKRQPNNGHIRILHTCTQVYYEADHIFRQYVSLHRETQILRFIQCATDTQKAQIRWADLANDGRSIEYINSGQVRDHNRLCHNRTYPNAYGILVGARIRTLPSPRRHDILAANASV